MGWLPCYVRTFPSLARGVILVSSNPPSLSIAAISSFAFPTEADPAHSAQKPLFLNALAEAVPAPLALPPIGHLRDHEIPPFLLLLQQRFLLGASLETQPAGGRVRGGFGPDQGRVFERGTVLVGFGAGPARRGLGFFVDRS